ncbi:hypothetical protein [Sphingorhabdus sp. EL138]|uniref:hypothetical protein n=1 Tax=Sphingorhabdus sp. EL138 TaxID=2073156 RepID=UPI0013A58E8D|nr:hypothetical protein [Sphingorhabdus sp. EL138]
MHNLIYSMVAMTAVLFVSGCSFEEPAKTISVDPTNADSFYLSAEIVGPEVAAKKLCPAFVSLEIDSNGDGTIYWNKEGEPGHHGCFRNPEDDFRTDTVSLNDKLFNEFKEKLRKIEWRGKFEAIENAPYSPNPLCEIHHNSLPDINLSMERKGLVIVRLIYTYELNGNRVSQACKRAIIQETDVIQEIIDLMPVRPPFSSKLRYRSKI